MNVQWNWIEWRRKKHHQQVDSILIHLWVKERFRSVHLANANCNKKRSRNVNRHHYITFSRRNNKKRNNYHFSRIINTKFLPAIKQNREICDALFCWYAERHNGQSIFLFTFYFRTRCSCKINFYRFYIIILHFLRHPFSFIRSSLLSHYRLSKSPNMVEWTKQQINRHSNDSFECIELVKVMLSSLSI